MPPPPRIASCQLAIITVRCSSLFIFCHQLFKANCEEKISVRAWALSLRKNSSLSWRPGCHSLVSVHRHRLGFIHISKKKALLQIKLYLTDLSTHRAHYISLLSLSLSSHPSSLCLSHLVGATANSKTQSACVLLGFGLCFQKASWGPAVPHSFESKWGSRLACAKCTVKRSVSQLLIMFTST